MSAPPFWIMAHQNIQTADIVIGAVHSLVGTIVQVLYPRYVEMCTCIAVYCSRSLWSISFYKSIDATFNI